MRNYICDGHEKEITHLLEGIGEEEVFSSLLLPKLYPEAEIEPMEQVSCPHLIACRKHLP